MQFDLQTIRDPDERRSAENAMIDYLSSQAIVLAEEKKKLSASQKFFRITGVHLLPDGKLRADGETVAKILSERSLEEQDGFVAMQTLRREIGMRDPEAAMKAFYGDDFYNQVEDNGKTGPSRRFRPKRLS